MFYQHSSILTAWRISEPQWIMMILIIHVPLRGNLMFSRLCQNTNWIKILICTAYITLKPSILDVLSCCSCSLSNGSNVLFAAYRAVLNNSTKTVRESLINQSAQILACYRKNCASPSSAGQVRVLCCKCRL